MDREQYLSLLREHDDPVNWEVPGGWENYDYLTARRRFLHFADDIEKALASKCEVESGSMIQDASFIGQINLPNKCSKEPEYRGFLRISHFGSFAAFSDDEELKPDCLDKIKDVIEKHGYVYIPLEILAGPYSGRNTGVTGIPNWVIRYFDYV